jgi:hypothetical protein
MALKQGYTMEKVIIPICEVKGSCIVFMRTVIFPNEGMDDAMHPTQPHISQNMSKQLVTTLGSYQNKPTVL